MDPKKFTSLGFDEQYVFSYFDRAGSGSITVKDLNLVLNILGVNPALPTTMAVCRRHGVSAILADSVSFQAYQKVLKEVGKPLTDKDEISQSVKIVAEFFARDPAKGVITSEQAHKILATGENKLTTAQMNQISTLAATSGAERGGQMNLNTLVSLVEQ